MRIPGGVFKIVKEVARHLLRRPVIGILAAARTPDGRWLLIRRGDTGKWALPGGTLEWGETLRSAVTREVMEETGANVLSLGKLRGIYSDPARDPRFHAVTVLVDAVVSEPERPTMNDLEITEVKLFEERDLPTDISQGLGDILDDARTGKDVWE